jgi:hypothetical protein
VYFAAVAPAAIAGWPLTDLLTVYLEQSALAFRGNAPNLWAIPVAAGFRSPDSLAMVAAAAAGVVLVVVLARTKLSAHQLMLASLLSALVLPFLLPRMHERFFILADLLALCLAYWRRDKPSLALCGLTQAGSALAYIAYVGLLPSLNAAASLFIAAALGLTIRIFLGSLYSAQMESVRSGAVPVSSKC